MNLEIIDIEYKINNGIELTKEEEEYISIMAPLMSAYLKED